MTTFYLIRHGQKEEIFGDPPLTQLGREQAEKTVEFFKNKRISLLFASPMRRTRETASFFSLPLSLMVNIDNRLKERLNWGEKTHESQQEFFEEWAKTDNDHSYISTHGESSVSCGMRMRTFLDELSEQYKNNAVLIVTHGGAIGDVLRNLFPKKSLPLTIDPKTYSPHIAIHECSITRVEQADGEYKLDSLNQTHHLP